MPIAFRGEAPSVVRSHGGRLGGGDRTSWARAPHDTVNSGSLEEDLRHAREEIAELKARLNGERTPHHPADEDASEFDDIVGQTPAVVRLLEQITQVAATNSTVLVTGETGTGKELVARAVHRRSRRHDRPLIVVNCAALSPTLVETELFGHEKGAFTGATSRRVGRFELANRGTIFLDEVGELPEELQVKLLRVLQTGEIERLGSAQTLRVDVRLIAATNRKLQDAVAEGRFRSDLYYRLHVFPVHVPSLRERRDDIPLLAAYLVEKKGKMVGKRIDCIPDAVMQRLTEYSWPGNVRELENVIERAIILSRDRTLQLDGVAELREPTGDAQASARPVAPGSNRNRLTLRDVERAHILSVCEDCGWRIKGPDSASVRLGLNPSTLYFRMHKLGIVRPS